MSVALQLKDLRSDVQTLLQYAQSLKAENDSLRGALKGSIVFLGNKEQQEKVFRALTGVGAAFPKLKTVADISSKSASHLSAAGNSRLPNASEGDSGHLNGGGNGDSGVNKLVEEVGEEFLNEGGPPPPPELFTTSDLADVLLEHNKLLGRLIKFTSSASTTSIPTSSAPNIGNHDLTEVGVVGFREQEKHMNDFVVHVSWSNGCSFEIYRKYLDFFTLQARLRELEVRKTRTPVLPLSDHLLVALGRLGSTESLYQRYKSVHSFCTALLDDIKEMEVGNVCRTSALIFFVPRPGDIQIEITRLESSYRLEAGGESDLDCLGFLSSVALAHDRKWYDTHSDLLDSPTTDDAPVREREANLRFTKPSLAHPILTQMHSAPTTHPVAPHKTPPNLSVLKASSSLDSDQQTGASDRGSAGWPVTEADFRHRASNIISGGEGALTRIKILCAQSGNMDWGVRETSTSNRDQNTSRDQEGGEELQCKGV